MVAAAGAVLALGPGHAVRAGAPSTSPTTAARAGDRGSLDLPRVPWAGGPAYWGRFPDAAAGGWDDPSFFPVGVWYSSINTDADVAWDKQHGINTYVQLNPGTDFDVIARNGQFWIGRGLNDTFDPDSPQWVGNFLDDEVDGRFPAAEGLARMRGLADRFEGNGKFTYTNYTGMVIQNGWTAEDGSAPGPRYVNGFTDVVSLDAYWLTSSFCQHDPFWSDYLVDIPKRTCNTGLSYGAATKALRRRDAADGRLQPVWMFVEDLNGGDTGDSITPTELKSAAMSAITNEARGIMWFDSSLTGSCQGNPISRLAQRQGPSYCGWDQVAAMGQVNRFIASLAPVLNTQSYRWDFGRGVTTMLKATDGYAYVFTTLDSSRAPGERTLRLPDGVTGSTAQVLGEHRSVPVVGGRLTDTFASYDAWHVYKIAL